MTTPREDDMTLGEIGRLVVKMSSQLSEMSAKNDLTFQRIDVAKGQVALINGRIDTIVTAQQQLRTDADAIVAQQLSSRRMWISGLVFPVLAVIISAYLVASGVHP